MIRTKKTWTKYKVYLTNKDNWRVGSLKGPAASPFQVKKALVIIKELLISGDFSEDNDQGYLDNVGFGTAD